MWWIIAIILAVFAVFTLAVYLLFKYKKVPGQRFTRIKEFAPVISACCAVATVVIAVYQVFFNNPPATKPETIQIIPELPPYIHSNETSGTSPENTSRVPPSGKIAEGATEVPGQAANESRPQYECIFHIVPPVKDIKVYMDGILVGSEGYFAVSVDSGIHEVRATSTDGLGMREYLDSVVIRSCDTIRIKSTDFKQRR